MKKHESPSGNSYLETTGYDWDICYAACLKCPDGKFRKTSKVTVGCSTLVATVKYKGKTITGEITTYDYPSCSEDWKYRFIPYRWLKNGHVFD
jgi:hypothetical protein